MPVSDDSTSLVTTATVEGWSLVQREGADERLLDHRVVAAKLGYGDISKFKQLVERYRDSGDLGHVNSATVAELGRTGPAPEVHYLTEFQALFCTGKSETKIANEIYRQIIEVYMAVRRGRETAMRLEYSRQTTEIMWLQREKRELLDRSTTAEQSLKALRKTKLGALVGVCDECKRPFPVSRQQFAVIARDPRRGQCCPPCDQRARERRIRESLARLAPAR